MKIEDTEVLRR